MGPDEIFGDSQLPFVQTEILRQSELWLNADLGLCASRRHMHVHPRFLARKEIEAEATILKDCRTQSGCS
jgi:hypothetical protein